MLDNLLQADIIALIILLICIVLFIGKWIPLAATGCLGCFLLVLFGVCSFEDAFSGFSNSIVFLMFGSLTVGIALFKTEAADIIGRFIIRISHGNEYVFLLLTTVVCGIAAMFLANTAILAAFIPIVESACRLSTNMSRRNLVLPIAYAVMLGGACTLVGCTPQMAANAIMQNMTGEQMGMWTMTAPGLCLLVVYVVYSALYGYRSGNKIWGKREETPMSFEDEKGNDAPEENAAQDIKGSALQSSVSNNTPDVVQDAEGNALGTLKDKADNNNNVPDATRNTIDHEDKTTILTQDIEQDTMEIASLNISRTSRDKRKLAIMCVIAVLMLISYATSALSIELTALSAAVLCVLFGLCSLEDIVKKMYWGPLILLASCLGLANGLYVAGSGDLIGNFVTSLLGDISSPFVIYTVFVVLTLFLSQFITNSAAILIVLPIALSICAQYGFPPMAYCVGITFAASVASCTLLAASQITMTEVAGYEFTDYIRYGWKPSLITLAGILIFVPLFFPLV